MLKFSANIGFLWTDLSHVDRILAAKKAGFDAVECHFPYNEPAREIKAALEATGLPMLTVNTVRGNIDAGDFGLAALPDRVAEARDAIDQAVAYAEAIGAANVHVMASRSRAKKRPHTAFSLRTCPMPAASLRHMGSIF